MVSLCLGIHRHNKMQKTSFILQFNSFLGDEKLHSPNGRVNCDLCSPDTLDTCMGERASANVQPCVTVPKVLPYIHVPSHTKNLLYHVSREQVKS